MITMKERILEFMILHKKSIKIWLFVIFVGTMIFRGVMQQPQINENRKKIARLEEQIEYEQARKAEIENLRDKVNSDEYIEKMASEKLGLVKSTAKIFIDVSQD